MYDQATRLRMIAESQEEIQPGATMRPGVPLFQRANIPYPVRTIAITSGKGGVGKTNIAANLGIAIAAQNKRVGIIDADLGLANIDVILKLKPRYNIEHVIAGRKTMEDIFVSGPAGLTIIPAGSGRLSLANLPELDRDRLIRKLMECTSDFDIMFIDTAAGISSNVMDFALTAQEIIVITTPEPTAITDAYAMIKVISQQRKADIGIIVNMVDNPRQAGNVADRIIMAARRHINANAHFMGHILTDAAVSDAIFAQQPLVFKYPESSAAQCINVLANKILNNGKK
ncbi:MinD/ParA family protein [Candidatus Poribacteria bacterium]